MSREPSQSDALAMEREGRIWDEYSSIPGIHFCRDWDEALIWAGNPEFQACTCYPTKRVNGSVHNVSAN